MAGTPSLTLSYGQKTFLLDLYPGSAGAYSFRQIGDVTNCIRVRRSSDNTEQDVPFVAGVIDTASLASFCSGTDGYVVKWYDQSGNANDAVQSTNSLQPRIVSSDTIDTAGSLTAMLLDGSNDKLDITGIGAAIGTSIFMVGKRITTGTMGPMVGTSNNSTFSPSFYAPYSNNRYGYVVDQGYTNSVSTYTGTNQELTTLLYPSSGTINIYVNSSSISMNGLNALTNTTDFLEIGSRSANSEYTNGYMQEVIFYTTDQTANQSGIETNIKNYYGL